MLGKLVISLKKEEGKFSWLTLTLEDKNKPEGES